MNFLKIIGDIVNFFAKIARQMWNFLLVIKESVITGLKNFNGVANAVTAVTTVFNAIKDGLSSGTKLITNSFGTLQKEVSGVTDWAKNAVSGAVTTPLNVIKDGVSSRTKLITNRFGTVQKGASGVKDWTKNTVSGAMNALNKIKKEQ